MPLFDVIVSDSDSWAVRVSASTAAEAMEIVQAVEDEGESLRDDAFGINDERVISKRWFDGSHSVDLVTEVKED